MTKPASQPRPRAQGRPDAVDSVGRSALLDAAIEELRSTPPQALTLAAVAARAGAHPALIRYYFGNKEGLLKEATRKLVEQAQDITRTKLESDAPFEEKLGERLNAMIAVIRSNPHYHQLVMEKIYAEKDAAEGQRLLSQITTRGMGLTLSMLHDNASTQLRPVDPRFLHITLIGLAQFFASSTPLLHELFGPEADFDELKDRYVAFMKDLILHGIAADTPAP